MASNKPNVYVVEGGIGAGKTFLLEAIDGNYLWDKKIVVVKEPLRAWCQTPHGNLLKSFCEDRARALEFQTLVMTTLSEQRKDLSDPNCVYFVERSLHSAHGVFQPILQSEGFLTGAQSYVLGKLYELLCTYNPVAEGVIFLDTPLEVALERLMLRNKSADESLTCQYVSTIMTQYYDYVDACPRPVLRVTPEDLQRTSPLELIGNWVRQLEGMSS